MLSEGAAGRPETGRTIHLWSDKLEPGRMCLWTESLPDGTRLPCHRKAVNNSHGCAYHSDAIITAALNDRRAAREEKLREERMAKREPCPVHGTASMIDRLTVSTDKRGSSRLWHCLECRDQRRREGKEAAAKRQWARKKQTLSWCGVHKQAKEQAPTGRYFCMLCNPDRALTPGEQAYHHALVAAETERKLLAIGKEQYETWKWEIRFWSRFTAIGQPYDLAEDLEEIATKLRGFIRRYPKIEHADGCRCLRCDAKKAITVLGRKA